MRTVKSMFPLLPVLLLLSHAEVLGHAYTQELPLEGIVFCSDRDGNREVYIMDPDGANLRNLTKHLATDEYPAASPDGSKIAFASDRDNPNRGLDIYIMEVRQGTVYNLTHDVLDEDILDTAHPAWSPDAQRIAFVVLGRPPEPNVDIYVMDADGSNRRRLTDHPGVDADPTWSPDGQWIAFHSDRDRADVPELYVMDVDGANARKLRDGNGVSPAWSPDGQQIAFCSAEGNAAERSIYLMDADGRNVRRLTRGALDTERSSRTLTSTSLISSALRSMGWMTCPM